MRRDAFDYDEAEHYRAQMLRGETLKDLDGKPVRVMDALGRMLRPAIIPEDGKVFVVGDWSAIESRMTAYLAGDMDKLKVFKSGEDPYCYAAEAIYGRPINAKDDPEERRVGKVSDLAGGYLGGENALASMAAQYRVHIPVDMRKDIIKAYRAKHPKIVAFGDLLVSAATRAVLNPNLWQNARTIKYIFNSKDGALYCQLPDHVTILRYPECRLEMRPVPWDEDELRPQLTALKAAFTPAADAKEWPRHGLWRGIFLENVASGSSSALLKECRLECEDEGLDLIFDVHDELIAEVPEAEAERAVATMQRIMEQPKALQNWLWNLPLVAKPKIMRRYGK
jgi:DNA polymerase